MFKIEFECENTVKPWMVFRDNDWTFLLGAIISIPMLLWGTIGSFLHRNWFVFAYLAVATVVFIWIVPKFIKVRRIIISRFGTDNWKEEILFNDDEIIVTESGSKGVYTSKRRYEEIVDIREEKNHIVLKMNTPSHIVFSKDAFVIGSWESCKQYVKERMGHSNVHTI